jgi:hypothetical protein
MIFVDLIETFRLLYTLDMLCFCCIRAISMLVLYKCTYFDDLRFFGTSYEFTVVDLFSTFILKQTLSKCNVIEMLKTN